MMHGHETTERASWAPGPLPAESETHNHSLTIGYCTQQCPAYTARPQGFAPCEHDTLGCGDRTPHDEHTKVGDGRPCCGWPPRCRE